MKSDFLLPDGIALQIFYFFATLFRRVKSGIWILSNLNGTDFVPYFFQEIARKYGNQKACILMYGSYPQYVEKAKNFLAFKGYNVVYAQDGYSDFDRAQANKILSHYHDTINILLVARSTTKVPIQELWTSKNMSEIKKNNILVMNVGGLFDFWAGAQKRAPKVIRMLKLERLRRLISQPKRNFIKVYYSLFCFVYIFSYLLLKKK